MCPRCIGVGVEPASFQWPRMGFPLALEDRGKIEIYRVMRSLAEKKVSRNEIFIFTFLFLTVSISEPLA